MKKVLAFLLVCIITISLLDGILVKAGEDIRVKFNEGNIVGIAMNENQSFSFWGSNPTWGGDQYHKGDHGWDYDRDWDATTFLDKYNQNFMHTFMGILNNELNKDSSSNGDAIKNSIKADMQRVLDGYGYSYDGTTFETKLKTLYAEQNTPNKNCVYYLGIDYYCELDSNKLNFHFLYWGFQCASNGNDGDNFNVVLQKADYLDFTRLAEIRTFYDSWGTSAELIVEGQDDKPLHVSDQDSKWNVERTKETKVFEELLYLYSKSGAMSELTGYFENGGNLLIDRLFAYDSWLKEFQLEKFDDYVFGWTDLNFEFKSQSLAWGDADTGFEKIAVSREDPSEMVKTICTIVAQEYVKYAKAEADKQATAGFSYVDFSKDLIKKIIDQNGSYKSNFVSNVLSNYQNISDIIEKYQDKFDEKYIAEHTISGDVLGDELKLVARDKPSGRDVMNFFIKFFKEVLLDDVTYKDYVNNMYILKDESGTMYWVQFCATTEDNIAIGQGVKILVLPDIIESNCNLSEFSQIVNFIDMNKADSANADSIQETIGGLHPRIFSSGVSVLTNTEVDLTGAVNAIKKLEESDNYDTGFIYVKARNAGTIAKYIVAKAVMGGVTDSEFYNLQSSKVESMTSKYSYVNFKKEVYNWLPDDVNRTTSKLNRFYEFADPQYQEKLSILLHDVTYAFEVMEFAEDTTFLASSGTDIKSMEQYMATEGAHILDWMRAIDGKDQFQASYVENLNFNNDEFCIGLYRSIIELHDLCTYLDINPDLGEWNDTIKNYYDYYESHKEFFELLRNNPAIYARLSNEPQTAQEPLSMFFGLESELPSDDWAKGFAISSLFVPMETNLYEASSVSFLDDSDWIADFYYKYAFYRKALYINTDNLEIVNKFISGKSGGTRVATFGDLLNYDRDIVLTIDTNFYNARDVGNIVSSVDYTGLRNTANTDDTATGFDAITHWVSDLFDVSPEQILKTAGTQYYSQTLAEHVLHFGEESSVLNITQNMVDGYVLSADDIIGDESVFKEDEYSVKVPYGVVSSIYRSPRLYNKVLNSLVVDNAIFKSSKAICNTPGTKPKDWTAIYNYYMLANLAEQMKNDAATTLDLNAPIFCDLFGNIVTESGLVIIPAAANPTLCEKNWTPYTVGFAEYYSNGEHIKDSEFSTDFYKWLTGNMDYVPITDVTRENRGTYSDNGVVRSQGGGYFVVNNSGELILRNASITSGSISGVIDFNCLSKNSAVIKQLFFNEAYYNKAVNIYGDRFINLVIETLRGAPIENIDYTYEGLSGNQDISKYGVFMAYKFEEILENIMPVSNGENSGGNSLVTNVNLAYFPGVEGIMLYVYKIIFALLIILLCVQIYMDAVKNKLGIKSAGRFLVSVVSVLLAFTIIPDLMNWSYYNANKSLLKEESNKIAMLNYVKKFDGAEVGITKVTTPETQTQLYIKLDDIHVHWWDMVSKVLFNNTFKTVSELYEEQIQAHPFATTRGVIAKYNAVYADVADIFDSTSINYNPTSGMLTNKVVTLGKSNTVTKVDADGSVIVTNDDVNAPVSYTLPYYIILDQLIDNVNEFNQANSISAYNWKISSTGHILTYGNIVPYLTSYEFLEDGMDILGLDRILETGQMRVLYSYNITSDQQEQVHRSLWYPSNTMTADERKKRIDKLYEYARNYILDNKSILSQVPDEVFIKSFALNLSLEYNRLFDVPYGRTMEIINVDTKDLARFMIASDYDVYKNYAYSYSRFVYEEAGGIGVILSAIFFITLWIATYLKPIISILIIALLVINILLRKVLFGKESRCLEGYLITCASLVVINYLYALALSLTMKVSDLNIGTVLPMILGLLVQILYIFLLCKIVVIEIKDWKNSGFSEFQTIGESIAARAISVKSLIVEKAMSMRNEAYSDTAQSRRYGSEEITEDTITRMHERDMEREENAAINPT